MSNAPELELTGCTPEPLMNYLKALGLLRIVSEQRDSKASGCWRNDSFWLQSELNADELVQFFLHDYSPTPIAGPWAGGSGFFGSDNRKAVNTILNSTSSRGETFRNVIKAVTSILGEEGITDKPGEDVKERLLRRYRREMPDLFVKWMDAAMALQLNGQVFAPVLGTGGNDGRLDFTQNYMQRLVELNLFENKPSLNCESLLRQALFGQPISGLGTSSVGQFSPGRAGGPNATQGMEGNPTDNPWDFILMLEGALMLAGSVARRMGAYSTDKAIFPFTVRTRPVGHASPTNEELGGSRGELWLPLWNEFTIQAEIEGLFAEGRAEWSGRPARDAVDFSRAVAGLGIDRGIGGFVRYGFLKRSGKAYLATAMDRFQVPKSPREAIGLLQRLDVWLDRFRRACSAKETPGRFRWALRRIENAIFEYCLYGRREDMRAILLALGEAERELALTGGHRGDKEICRPLGGLPSNWLEATHDGSIEFEIALALAGIHDQQNKIEPFRSNIEPVTFEKGRWVWQESGPHVVWNSADLSRNMAAVLERRIMDGARAGCDGLPFDSHRTVPLKAVATFIADEADDRRIEDLLWGLILINHRDRYPADLPRLSVEGSAILPREYALLKLLFLPRPLMSKGDKKGITIRPEPRIVPLLRTGHVEEACRIACQRLRASGLVPMSSPKVGDVSPSLDSQRLAAALLLPISNREINRIVHLVTRQDEESETVALVTEGADEP